MRHPPQGTNTHLLVLPIFSTCPLKRLVNVLKACLECPTTIDHLFASPHRVPPHPPCLLTTLNGDSNNQHPPKMYVGRATTQFMLANVQISKQFTFPEDDPSSFPFVVGMHIVALCSFPLQQWPGLVNDALRPVFPLHTCSHRNTSLSLSLSRNVTVQRLITTPLKLPPFPLSTHLFESDTKEDDLTHDLSILLFEKGSALT